MAKLVTLKFSFYGQLFIYLRIYMYQYNAEP